ncbi:hypothetical protein CSC70_13300 [Pseudoxanthomonas kalamensis DSM 18571]|uniref:hypothetical protein n=1 Tax=Pseudoxanthomonas kalamensis TaxID=289483 RepID=UPI0013916646|nr:hypothetical protein [Pseudoxanthomonas kalamensis]KAF1708114.1 hypothetical protein CSC70_13300 [Pseudoxanthomonas kalamensis DSM 18571]
MPDASARRLPRWLTRSLIGLGLAYAVYLLAGNLFLNTPLSEVVNRKPDKFRMHWERGSTWWPGRISLSGVRMQGHAGHVQWSAQAERASGQIALLPLLRKELRFPEVRAEQVSGRVDRVQDYLAPPDYRPGGWTLRFDRIVSDSVREGGFGRLHLQGKGSAEVGFVKQMRSGPMQLLPSRAHFDAAVVRLGKHELLRDGVLDADFSIDRHSRAEASGIHKLKYTTLGLRLHGRGAALKIVVDPQGDLQVDAMPERGELQADLGFERGALTPGSRLDWQMPVDTTNPQGVMHHDQLRASLAVDQDMSLQLSMPALSEGIFGLDTDLRVQGRQLPLDDPRSLLARSSGRVAGRWRFSSLRWLTRMLVDAPWLEFDGRGDVDVDVKIEAGKPAAGSRFRVPDIAAVAHVMGNRIEGRASAVATLLAGAKDELAPQLDVAMQRFSIAPAKTPDAPYVQGNDLRLELSARDSDSVQQVRDSLRARLRFDNARVPDLRAYNRYLPRGQMRFTGGSGRLSGDLHLDPAGEIGRGWLRVQGRDARVELAGLSLRGDLDLDTRLQKVDLARREFAIDGSTLALRGVSFSEPGGETRSDWWGKLELPRTRMDWDTPMRVDGDVRMELKDVGFLLSLFSRQKEYPKWVYRLVDDGQARASGRLRWQGDTLTLDRVDAGNDRFDLLARLRLRGKRPDGSLYAKWGVLSTAVELQGGQRKFHVVRARQWYDAQPALLP